MQGASLIEVLLAVLVLSLGLLGALKLQTEGVRQNADSRYTVLASTYAQNALDAVAFDREDKKSDWIAIRHDTAVSAVTAARANEWLTGLKRDLPAGTAEVDCSSTGKKCWVEIKWAPPGTNQNTPVSAKYEMYN